MKGKRYLLYGGGLPLSPAACGIGTHRTASTARLHALHPLVPVFKLFFPFSSASLYTAIRKMVAHEHGGCCGGHGHGHEAPPAAAPEDSSPPHSVGSEIDVSKDGGVMKHVLVEGTGSR